MSRREHNGRNGWSGIGLMCGLAALFGLSFPIAAQAQFSFIINSPDTNAITIIGYTGVGGSVDIPSNIEGKVVARIGDYAFCGRGDLTAVEIPDSVTSLGERAFGSCNGGEPFSGLSTVIIGNGVTNIEHEVFSYNDALTGVYFHGDAPTHEDDIFYDAEDVVVYHQESAAGWPAVPALWADRPTALWLPIPEPAPYTYTTNSPDTNTLTITGYTGAGGTADIPSIIAGKTVTAIGIWAFENCNSLTCITIPDSVTTIGRAAFAYCSGLTSVTLGNSVTNIGDRAFTLCSSLTNATLGNSVSTIGDSAFVDCTSLNSIAIPDSVTTIGVWAFMACTSLTHATLGNSVTNIGSYAFVNCTSLTGITIPDSVIALGEQAFTNCISLTNASIGSSVTNIGCCSFEGCTGLTRITIPDSVTAIGAGAFGGCASLTDATLGNGVANIGYCAFEGCSSLSRITIPDSVTAIEVGAFGDCTSLTNAGIGNGVTNIGDEAFAGCSRLIEITASYGNSAYSSSNGVLFNKDLTTLVQCPGGWTGVYAVPDSVTHIGSGAFRGCNQLSSVHIPDSVLNIGIRAFGACSSLTNAIIGNNVTAIRYRAFGGCASLTRITIPASVLNIQDWTFANCTSLTGIYFQGNAPYKGMFVFDGADNATVYYSPHTTGWPPVPDPWAWRPTALWQWRPSVPGEVGVVSNHFGFNIISPSGMVVVVDACTNLIQTNWVPVATHVLTNGTCSFSDAEWTNYPGRFYRMRSQ